ncbi:MAG TPA: MFS transporter [Mycobacteriales bacterium]|nr:MFS transporter [Mycobacteriales bacterium]
MATVTHPDPDQARTTGRLGAAFGRLWGAAAVSTVGDGMTLAAVPLLAATLTRDPVAISLVNGVSFLPWVVVGLLSGALVDRWDRRRTMWTVDLVRAVVVAGLAVAVLAGAASIPLLCAAVFLLGCGQTLFDSAAQAAIPAVVSRDPARLHKANGRMIGTQTIGQSFIGPPVGGALFPLAHWVPFAADAVSFLSSSALVGSLRGRFEPAAAGPAAGRAHRRSVRTDIAEGVRWLFRHRFLRTMALTACILNFAGAAAYGLLVLFAQDRLGLGSLGFGLLLTAEAVGALAGSLVAGRVSRRLGTTRAMAAAMLVQAAAVAAFGTTRAIPVAAVAAAVQAGAIGVWNVLGQSLRQELTPSRLMGRVVTSFRMIGLGGIPLGALCGGFLARGYGLTAGYLLAAAMGLLAAGLAAVVLTEPALAAARAAAAGPADPADR